MATKAPQIRPTGDGVGLCRCCVRNELHARKGEFQPDSKSRQHHSGPRAPHRHYRNHDTSESFSGQTLGAVSGLSLGYNYIVDSKSIVGALVEGGLTDTHVNLKGSGIMTTVQTSVTTPPGGAAGTTSLTNTSANTELS